MTDAALAGFGVVRTPGLTPAANNTVVANISGGTAYPTNVPISSIPFEAADITVGTTTITNGNTGRLLYSNAGVLGQMTNTGTGTVAVLQTAPTLITPDIGAATGTTIALGGATLGANVLAVTGNSTFAGAITTTGSNAITSGQNVLAGNIIGWTNASSMFSSVNGSITFANNALTNRVTLTVAGATATPNFQLGAAAVDTAPVAQTFSVQNTLAGGTSNVAGANFTIAGSQGKGTGVGGSIIFQTAAAGSTGTTVNPLVTALTIDSTGLATFVGSILVPGKVNFTNAPAFAGNSTTRIELNSGSFGTFRDLILRDLYSSDATFFARSATTLTNNAAAAAGTLLNAPTAGNPTKWIGIDDNGTTRFIPAW